MPKSQSSKPTTRTGRRAELSAKAKKKPTFTRPSGGATRRYVASKPNETHSGTLHQSRTLEEPAVDKPQDRHETGGFRASSRKPQLAGNIVEVSEPTRVPSPPEQSGESGAVTRPFVLGKGKRPLMPAHPARVRQLLRDGKAAVNRRLPFVIRLKTRKDGDTQPVAVKLDPGANTTGIALVRLVPSNPQIQIALFLAELTHRGSKIRDSLTQRAAFRGARRARKTRYRAPRFDNRSKPTGWLPPSLRHRLQTTMSWVARFRRWAPVTKLVTELVRFDTQLMENPEISGTEYQRGTLHDYETWAYLLEKWGRRCVYCDAENVSLEREHIFCKAAGGSNRVSNLTVACHRCNQAKGQQDVRDFVKNPERLQRILAHAKTSLAATAAVNATRFALLAALRETGLPVETGTGGQTKWNRTRLGLPKAHALDALCVGSVESVRNTDAPTIAIRCYGRGSRKRTRLTKDGFPRGYLASAKDHFGFRTGDIVAASVPAGKKSGYHIGRIAVRKSGSFNIQTLHGTVQGISHKHCRKLQPADGFAYSQTHPGVVSSRPQRTGFPPRLIQMNEKLRRFEDELNRVLNDPDFDDLEIAEIIGVMQIKLHVQCQRLMTRTVESDPADDWKNLKDE